MKTVTRMKPRALGWLAAAMLVSPVAALAQGATGASSDTQATTAQTTVPYWTAQRLLSAKPMDLHPRTRADGLPVGTTAAVPAAPGQSQRGQGKPPSVEPGPAVTLYAPQALHREQFKTQSGVIPEATSSFGAFYTTGQEITPAKYPARTAGQLFFHDPVGGGNFVCSASVLRPRIIMTAGHCIAHPSTNPSQRYFYTGHLFVPALTNGKAAFGRWTASQLWVTNAWFFSDGSVPNNADEGIMIAADQNIKGATHKIGDLTGWLGWITFALANNNITMKGYPCNLDNCARMETTNAQTFASGGNNTYIYGSAMRGGASGGPWIQDYGWAPVSNPPVSLGNNYLAGVTSYGPIATEPAYLGASQFDSNFTNLLNSACGAATGNC